MKLHDATLAILCGGEGKRLGGVDKGLLLLDGAVFIEHLLRLRELFAESVLVTSNPAPYARFASPLFDKTLGEPAARGDVSIVPDAWINLGAPGALHTALCSSRTDWTFVVAVDMPLMDAHTVTQLAASRSPDVDVVCAEGHPLGAFYRSALCEPFGALLDEARTPSLRELLTQTRRRSPASIDPRAFTNANTDEQLRAIGALRPSAC